MTWYMKLSIFMGLVWWKNLRVISKKKEVTKEIYSFFFSFCAVEIFWGMINVHSNSHFFDTQLAYKNFSWKHSQCKGVLTVMKKKIILTFLLFKVF